MIDMSLTKKRIVEIEARAGDLIEEAIGPVDQTILPVDLSKILKNLGLTLKYGLFENEEIAGFYDKNAKTIYVSESEAFLRQVFTIAHEVGHFMLHSNKISEVFYRANAFQFDIQNEIEETEANCFAASLMMPRSLVGNLWEIVQDEGEMARTFGVSRTAMVWRLKNLDLLP